MSFPASGSTCPWSWLCMVGMVSRVEPLPGVIIRLLKWTTTYTQYMYLPSYWSVIQFGIVFAARQNMLGPYTSVVLQPGQLPSFLYGRWFTDKAWARYKVDHHAMFCFRFHFLHTHAHIHISSVMMNFASFAHTAVASHRTHKLPRGAQDFVSVSANATRAMLTMGSDFPAWLQFSTALLHDYLTWPEIGTPLETSLSLDHNIPTMQFLAVFHFTWPQTLVYSL